MKRFLLTALLLATPAALFAADPAPLAPPEIVAQAPAADWTTIAAQDLLVMDLAPEASGKARRVVIQLMPPPFAQGWIGNIRKLAAAHWWDGTSVNRVQDNYVVQWGDAEAEDQAKAKQLPEGLAVVAQGEYDSSYFKVVTTTFKEFRPWSEPRQRDTQSFKRQPKTIAEAAPILDGLFGEMLESISSARLGDGYAPIAGFFSGFPVGAELKPKEDPRAWPVHCYGTVGVGRNMPPDTGSGAELYAVIGTPPRHLDRNIAVVGRVIEGIEHLSALPRGTGPLGFYATAQERVPIRAIRLGSEVPGLATYQYLSTESPGFARYADARANRRDAFFIRPAGGADICNVPVPVRRAP